MFMARVAAVAVCLTASVCLLSAKDPVNPAKLVGVWEIIKGGGGAPPGATVEFTADGKMIMKGEVKGKAVAMTCDYVIAGDKVIQKIKIGEKELSNSRTVVKLTDTDMHTKDDKGTIDEFKRKAK